MSTTNFIGLSTTQPTIDGANITENFWPNYARLAFDNTTWHNSGTVYYNLTMISFPVSNIPANTFYTAPYFVIYNSSNNFICAGSVAPSAYMGPASQLTFNAGQFIYDTSVPASFIPLTSNIAFPAVIAQTFVPTYEPAALSVPIKFFQNMRS